MGPQRLLPQCVVIDKVLNDMDADSIQKLAEDWNMPNVPFIALRLPDYDRSNRTLEVSGYLAKPFSIKNP